MQRGFEWLVAWRYLRDPNRRISAVLFVGIALLIVGVIVAWLGHGMADTMTASQAPASATGLSEPQQVPIGRYVFASGMGLAVLGGWVTIFGACLSAFRLFTTISIFGVFVGTQALIFVLAVMSGFEGNLRRSILGNNAHVVITKGHKPFDLNPALRAHLFDEQEKTRIPELVSAAPYLKDEVILSGPKAHSGVYIKGIDPRNELSRKLVGKNIRIGTLDNLIYPERLRYLAPVSIPTSIYEEDDVPPDILPPGFTPPEADELLAPSRPGDIPPPRRPATIRPPETDRWPPFPAARRAADDRPRSQAPVTRRPPEEAVPARPGTTVDIPRSRGGTASPLPLPSRRPPRIPGGHPPLHRAVLEEPGGRADQPPGAPAVDTPAEPPPPVLPLRPTHPRVLPGIIVGRELAKTLGLQLGDAVDMISTKTRDIALTGPMPRLKEFRVAGVFFSGHYEYDQKYAYVSLPVAQEFLRKKGKVTGLEIQTRSSDHAQSVARRIREVLGAGSGYTVRPWQQIHHAIFAALEAEKMAMFLVLVIIVLVASFSIVANLIMVVAEKSGEIAVLRSMGAKQRNIMRIFLYEGVYIGLIGLITGLSTGILLSLLLRHYGFALDPEIYYIQSIPVSVDPVEVAVVAAAVILISLLAALFPAMRAMSLTPVRGLRYK